ncbi:hypothetical protein L484_001750 [Morus notabilis]|uniref:Uncharacterized protein n=1 Tax=Morus notabilis TaxID=981085 RepID=W9QE72_9ROSA|nr:hypothetical protein L484_001750 [Morus notabilis]
MGYFGKKPSVEVLLLKVVVVTALIVICMAVAEAKGLKEDKNWEKFESQSEKHEYKVAMPLYRVKTKPHVLIPESRIPKANSPAKPPSP